MGRAERRRQERNGRISDRKGKIALRPDQIQRIKNDAADTASKFGVDTLMTCFAQVLHTEFGWGRVRILRVLNAVDETFGRVLTDGLSIQEMRQKLEDEVGLRIRSD